MSKNKIYLAIFSFVISLIIGTWIATQHVASMFNYHPALGEPITVINKVPIYYPKFFSWESKFGEERPLEFDESFNIIYLSLLIAMAIPILLIKTVPISLSSHGTARWATDEEIKKTTLLDNKGIVLGKLKDGRYLRHNGPHHCFMMAPTRSGKGVSSIIPTLLSWIGSVIVTDIKGENWAYTSAYRKEKLNNYVIKFEPSLGDGSSARFNPFCEIRIGTDQEVKDIQNMANILVDDGSGSSDHWSKSAMSLFVGVILHLLYVQKENACFGSLVAFLSSPDKTFEALLLEMLSTTHDTNGVFLRIYGEDTEIHPIVAQTAREMSNKEPKELANVLSTVMSLINLYRDPILARNTARSDFSINDLMNNDKPVSLYLIVPPSDIDRMNPVFRLILELILRRNLEKMEFAKGKTVKSNKNRLLLLLDEFPSLGRLDTFERALAYIAGYDIKALIIVQSVNQLYKNYTHDNSIIDNCHIRIVHTPNDDTTPQFISKMLGKKTIEITNKTYSGHGIFSNVSLTKQSMARDLMTPDEVSTMDADNQIILVSGFHPIMAKKIYYYQDNNFESRKSDAPKISDVIVKKSPDSDIIYEKVST